MTSLGYPDIIEFFLLENMEEAEQEVKHHKKRVEGVFFTSWKLSRGLDMKFGADSLVICLDFVKKSKYGNLRYTDILQQIGRSSRTREISLGHILVEGNKALGSDFSDVSEYLKSKKERGLNLSFL